MIWILWMEQVVKLEKAFSRKKTFYWAISVLMAMTINLESLGVTSFIRCTLIDPFYYSRIIAFFHSTSINLKSLTEIWCDHCFLIFKNFFLPLMTDMYS